VDYNPKWGGGSNDPTCTSCNLPITPDQRSKRIEFANDPHGYRGLSGLYHVECSKPFDALASTINVMSSARY
jgi:hypothetical protein